MKYLVEPFIQVQDINGKPVAGAKIYVKESDTTNSVITYQNFDGGLNTVPVLTDELGNATVLVADDCGLCDVYVYDDKDNLLFSKKYITPGQGGEATVVSITEGYGCTVSTTGNTFVIGVDTSLIATKDDLNAYQEKLSGGDNIEIVQNVVNVTGRRTLAVRNPLRVTEESNKVVLGIDTNAFQMASGMDAYLEKSVYASDSATFLTGVDLSNYATVGWTQACLDTKLDVTAYNPGSFEISGCFGTRMQEGGSTHTELLDYFPLPDISGKYPRAVIGNYEWASTDGYLSFYPAIDVVDGSAYSFDGSQFWNDGHGQANTWKNVCLNFTASDNSKMKYIAIKGSNGESFSGTNGKFTCIY